ncbi:MAG: hypothetical protein IIZ43_03845 [Eubacterium sp.]|nr:hypothetical protein [Eubacterium sp.]
MPLILLGFIFVAGLLVYYFFSSGRTPDDSSDHKPRKPKKDDDLRTEDNVIYLSDDIDKIKRNHNIGNDD